MALNLRMVRVSAVRSDITEKGIEWKTKPGDYWYIAADNIAFIDSGNNEFAKVFIKHDLSGEGSGSFTITKDDLQTVLKAFIIN